MIDDLFEFLGFDHPATSLQHSGVYVYHPETLVLFSSFACCPNLWRGLQECRPPRDPFRRSPLPLLLFLYQRTFARIVHSQRRLYSRPTPIIPLPPEDFINTLLFALLEPGHASFDRWDGALVIDSSWSELLSLHGST